MKSINPLMLLLGIAAASRVSRSCRDLILDPKTQILSGECNDGQLPDTAWVPAELDLNTCLSYDTEQDKILWQRDGNFGAECGDCYLDWEQDPIWRIDKLVMNCTCFRSINASFPIDDSPISNKYGTLVCIW
ncbi:hypothetical protein VTH82DRAFT_6817 [Thermothelomyces myriococcoides]